MLIGCLLIQLFAVYPHSLFGDHTAMMPGWSNNCTDLRKQNLYWHRTWADCGRPQTYAVADIMRTSSKKYRLSILQARKQEANIHIEKIVAALLQDAKLIKLVFWGIPLVAVQLVGLQHLLISLMLSGARMQIFIMQILSIPMN